MAWYDFFKLFTYALGTEGPLAKKKDIRRLDGAGTTQPDVLPDLRNSDGYAAGANAFIRIQNDLVDLTTTTNRVNRYKEYDRLVASVPEIEMAMTVFADEACIGGDTEIATVFSGLQKIKDLLNEKRFPVYCWDFEKQDYTIGWAFNPRQVKVAKTLCLIYDNGKREYVTPDHRILHKDGYFIQAQEITKNSELMTFYRVRPNNKKEKVNQFPRIFTNTDGWIHERQFIDEWRLNKNITKYDAPNEMVRLIASGLTDRQVAKLQTISRHTIKYRLKKIGFSYPEIRNLAKLPDHRNVIRVEAGPEMPVYDLSVEEYENFCTSSTIMHNCQKNEDHRTFKVEVNNTEVKEELEYLFFHRTMLNLDQKSCWDKMKRLLIKGDAFWEIVIDPDDPKAGIYKIADIPPESMYRIETTKGKLLEFQQGKEGPDYQAIQRAPVTTATDAELSQSNAVRFAPEQIIHIRLGDYRKSFYPYGVSTIESARGPAHQLRLFEDAMIVYRLVRAPERLVFYIDTMSLSSAKSEAFIERIKDQFRKKKVVGGRGAGGINSVEERYHAPSMEENLFVPLRGNSQTRIESLPGACLALDTKIPLLDGRTLTLQDIIEERKTNEDMWVYSCCPKTGKSAVGLISHAEVTRRDTEVVEVTFDNNEKVVCTPDHKFPVQGRGRVEAKDLASGDSMMPFNRRMKDEEQVYDISLRRWIDVCSVVTGKTVSITHLDGNKSNNLPSNLNYASKREETNAKISAALTEYHENLTEEEVESRNEVLRQRGLAGNAALVEKLQNDEDFRAKFSEKQKAGMAKSKQENPDKHAKKSKAITERNNEFWADEAKREQAIANRTIRYPIEMFNKFIELKQQKMKEDEIVKVINNDKELIQKYIDANSHMKRQSFTPSEGITKSHFIKLVKYFKYESVKHALNSINEHNHKVVSVKYLSEKQDTGTLTIANDHHTFALSICDIYTFNSNLGEIDDAVFFRNKLFVALNFPKNYFNSEDPSATRITLSSLDCKFARLIERFQSYFEDGLWEIADRHLKLRGFPPECYEDLNLPMTPPSDWRELSRAELITGRINNSTGLKGSQLMSDFDVLTKWMKYNEDEANEMISRMKLQKLEDLKLQVLAQNPALLGVGLPGQGETEVGAEPGTGANPMLGDQQGSPPTGGQPPQNPQGQPQQNPEQPQQGAPSQGNEQQQPPAQQKKQAKPLPEPTEEEIIKYDFELQNYDAEQDEEDIDYSTVE